MDNQPIINWASIPAAQYPFLKNNCQKTNRKWRKNNYCESIYINCDNGNYYHKDPLHGEIEAYNKKGKHIGVLLPTGIEHPKKNADKDKSLRGFI